MRYQTWLIGAALAAAACTGSTHVEEPDLVDTDLVDTDLDDTAVDDTGAPAERPLGAVLPIVVDNPHGRLAVAVEDIDRNRQDRRCTTAVATLVDGTGSLTLEPPAIQHLSFEPSLATPTVFCLPYLFEDADGDGEKGTSEGIVGVDTVALVWVEAETIQTVDAGFVPGWNVLTAEAAAPATAGLFLSQNLRITHSLTISGTIDAASAHPDRRTGLAPFDAFEGGERSTTHDSVAAGAWSITVEGPPAQLNRDGAGMLLPVSYVDRDTSGAWTDADTGALPACAVDEPVLLLWVPVPTDPKTAVYLFGAGATPGWTVFRLADLEGGGNALQADERSSLTFGTTRCAWPE